MGLTRQGLIILLAGVAALAQPVMASEWPTRLVTVLVPTAAGGNTDLMARLGADFLSRKTGKSFVVENRPSAGGIITATQVANAAPDGYTILFAPSAGVLLAPLVQKFPFDPGKRSCPGDECRHRDAGHRDQAQPPREDAR